MTIFLSEGSGEDAWFSEVLDECRQGILSETNYRFLHGLPTTAPIRFWYALRNTSGSPHDSSPCAPNNRCEACMQETRRRNRVLNIDTDAESAARKLSDARFSKCVLITPYHRAVFQFSAHRAQSFARAQGHQLFWMQAVDNPPLQVTEGHSKADLQEMKKRWLQFHSKKTEGVLSLCPCCRDMPVRVTSGKVYKSKEYGVHNGSCGILKSWELAQDDIEMLKTATDEQIVLKRLPMKLIIQMDRPLKQQYPGLEPNCFPLTPIRVDWQLDADGNLFINRRGFPIVPNFSRTVDSATGKTLDTQGSCELVSNH